MPNVTLDIFRLSEDQAAASGVCQASELPRLALHEGKFTEGRVSWTLTGTAGRLGLAGAVLQIEADLSGTCCRCGKPLAQKLSLNTPLLFARSEADADAIPLSEDGDDEIVVGSVHLDVCSLIEEEILLALPLYPSHDSCDAPVFENAGEDEAEFQRPNPFAVLASIKKN